MIDRGSSAKATRARARAAGRRASSRSGRDAGHVLVADLGATSIDVALTTLDGRILGHHDEPSLHRGRARRHAWNASRRCLTSSCRTTHAIPGRLWGVGIGVPGPVEFETGRPISPPIMPGWDGYPIRERFAGRYRAPVWVDNDVNVMALGEWRSGVAAGHSNVVVVKVGTGIGAGIISDGRLHRGAQGSAGDVGHIQVSDDPAVICRCGNIGCLEALAGGAAMAGPGEAAAEEGRSRAAAGSTRPARRGDSRGRRRAASFGDPVAVAMLGDGRAPGRLDARERRQLLQSVAHRHRWRCREQPGPSPGAIRETVYGRSLPLATRDLRRPAIVARWAGRRHRGSAMVVDQLFARDSLAQWIEAGEPSGAHQATPTGVG